MGHTAMVKLHSRTLVAIIGNNVQIAIPRSGRKDGRQGRQGNDSEGGGRFDKLALMGRAPPPTSHMRCAIGGGRLLVGGSGAAL